MASPCISGVRVILIVSKNFLINELSTFIALKRKMHKSYVPQSILIKLSAIKGMLEPCYIRIKLKHTILI